MGTGNVLSEMERLDEAEKYYLQAVQLYEKLGDTIGIADCQLALGKLYYKKQKYDSAREAYQKALSGHQKAGDQEKVAKDLLYVSNVLQALKQGEAAIQMIELSLQIHIEQKLPGVKSVTKKLLRMRNITGNKNAKAFLQELTDRWVNRQD